MVNVEAYLKAKQDPQDRAPGWIEAEIEEMAEITPARMIDARKYARRFSPTLADLIDAKED